MKSFSLDRTNALCGVLFILLGLFFVAQSLSLELGTTVRMGPGYFPLVLAAILTILGMIILVQSARTVSEPMEPLALRGMLFILAAPIVFGMTVRGLGFVPALFLAALIACFASQRMRPGFAVILSICITLFSVAVFSYALGLPFERFGPWLRF